MKKRNLKLALSLTVTTALSLVTLICTSPNVQAAQNAKGVRSMNTNEIKTEHLKTGMNRVEFTSEGERMIGTLFLPTSYKAGDKLPAIVIVGSLTSVKEQMATLYARKLNEQGFAALAFDYRFFGESGGEPRQYESPKKHIADISSAVAYLKTLHVVDPERIGGLGICTGSGYMAVAAAKDKNIRSYAGVAMWIPSAESNLELYGGEDGVRAKREAGRTAVQKYEQTKKADYLLAYGNRPNDLAAAARASHSGPMEYYYDAARGVIPEWTNRFAVMSWEEWLDYAPLGAATKINVPTLVIHSDNAALPENARKFYEAIKAPKDLVWTKDAHFDFYDKEPLVTASARAVGEHFKNSLTTNRKTAATTE